MSGLLRPCMEILPSAQQRLWRELSAAKKFGMALYGGTAIALHLGHRASVDFDFFTQNPLDKNALRNQFPFMSLSTVLQETENGYTLLVPYGEGPENHVKVSFFGAIQIGRVGDPSCTEDGVLQVASLDDLMATKVKVLLQRVEAKDYIDIAAMVKSGVGLAKGLAAARMMYGQSFQPGESLKALVYFEGGDLATLTTETKNILIAAASAVRDLPPVKILSRELAIP